ncbi:MAG: RNA-directed DNA polymerase [Candidatus Micrarchaeota archaeon]
MGILKRKLKDTHIIWLIRKILDNNKTAMVEKGMPIGNLTSQFFANVYLNELDQFVKHKLKAKYYIRYVDDFVVLHSDKNILEKWKNEIDAFLRSNLAVELHPEKSRILSLRRGITFLGFRIFSKYKLLKKSNARRIWKRLERFKQKCNKGEITRAEVVQSLEGWLAYAEFANSYKFRKRVIVKFNELFDTNKENSEKLSKA